MDFNLDFRAGITAAVILAVIGTAVYIIGGIRTIRSSRKIAFYRIKRDTMVRGWRYLFLGLTLAVIAVLANTYGEPLAYLYFPPSPTASPTSTITLTPTISPVPSITTTPTISPTPSESETPTPTETPHVPEAVASQFESVVNAPEDAVFSSLVFSQGINDNYEALNPGEVFDNPVGHMYAIFTYDKMTDGVQWTALWYYQGNLVHFETQVWDGGSGGIGYTDWNPPAEEWLEGSYQVQLFLNRELKVLGGFFIQGEPPAPTETPTSTPSTTPSITPTPSVTPWPTLTRTPTPEPSLTAVPSNTPLPTATRTPWPPTATNTPRPTYPATSTPSPTLTRWPTATPLTPTPTNTRWPTATNSP